QYRPYPIAPSQSHRRS
ncbi:type IIG restriction-modification enzyme, partial [Helicobacter pylori]